MERISSGALLLVGVAFLLGFGSYGLTSLKEKEQRATRIFFSLALLGFLVFSLVAFLSLQIKLAILGLFCLTLLVLIALFSIPVGRIAGGNDKPQKRFDERDIMFARVRLKPGSLEYDGYYATHPESKASDDRTRAKPGLLSLQSQLANPILFSSPEASFSLTSALREAVDGPVSEIRYSLPIEKMTEYLKGLAHYYGALQVGITELRSYHVYSHVGRDSGIYGAPITIDHCYAIAFTVEMDFQMVGMSPAAPVIMESARQYVEAARIAVQLAGAIRYLGYSARAHIDGNYRVIAPLVARDAGLGEIGRMGLLMTPRQGPRVRLGVVTTDLELVPDQRKPVATMIDFCTICKKCADNCPSKAIPFGDRQEIDGVLRWRIDSGMCFHYWNVIGTDCGRCMAVCPYSHPDSFSHNLVRWGIAHSGFFRRTALWMDDFFYGRRPSQREAPDWIRVS